MHILQAIISYINEDLPLLHTQGNWTTGHELKFNISGHESDAVTSVFELDLNIIDM